MVLDPEGEASPRYIVMGNKKLPEINDGGKTIKIAGIWEVGIGVSYLIVAAASLSFIVKANNIAITPNTVAPIKDI